MISIGRISVSAVRERGANLWGHPSGLIVLFATETCERFAYYGMNALLVLYMVQHLLLPSRAESIIGYAAVKSALEMLFGPLAPQPLASQLFGFFTGFAYLAPILGGLLADRVLGRRLIVILGAILMAIGHFMMAVESLFLFALLFLIVGGGAFKPNISSQVGQLYPEGDNRVDRAYAIFYVGVNIGAFFAPLVCGTIGESYGWRYGFVAAGAGMLIGLLCYIWGTRALPPDTAVALRRDRAPLDRKERRVVAGLVLICLLVVFFWATYDQQSNVVVLWTKDFTDRSITVLNRTFEIPITWFQALNPLLIFCLTPFVLRLWAWQGRRGTEPSEVAKMTFGFLMVAVAYLIMALAAIYTEGGKASWLWLVGYFVVLTIGELYLSPIGLALVYKVASPKIIAMMMGIWFATSFPGDILAGWLGTFWDKIEKSMFFLLMGAITGAAGAVLWAAQWPLRKLLEDEP